MGFVRVDVNAHVVYLSVTRKIHVNGIHAEAEVMSLRPEYLISGEPARLIPVGADSNREQKATGVLLSALGAVFEFRKALLGSIGVRVGRRSELTGFTEVVLGSGKKGGQNKEARSTRPDGLVILDTGRNQWRALVEAKVGNSELDDDQVLAYVQQAKDLGLDAVVTVSNDFVARPEHHPVKLPKRLSNHVGLFHWSWMKIVTEASLLLDDNRLESPDQRYVLNEVRRFLTHDSSGISRFDRMNREWKEVVGAFQRGTTLKASSEQVENTVSAWHQEQRDLCLVLTRKLGQEVDAKLPRTHRKNPEQRLKEDGERLVKHGRLECTLDVPNAAADLEIVANLTRRTISCSMRLDAPEDKKRTRSRANWLVRQLKDANTDGIYVRALRRGRAETTEAPLAEVLEDGSILESSDTDAVASAFEVFYLVDLAGRFSGNKVFIEELEKAVPHFYEEVGERLRAWVPAPPRLRREQGTSGPGCQEGLQAEESSQAGASSQ